MSEITLKGQIEQAISLLQNAKQEAIILISEAPESGNIEIMVETALRQLVGKLAFVSGIELGNETVVEFPPITSFMGEDIVLKQDITQEDLSPSELERRVFLEKVANLFSLIDTLDASKVLINASIPEDQLVLRGVAKMAGVDGYDVKELDIAFVQEIIEKKAAKLAATAEDNKIDAEIARQHSIATIETRIKESEAKKEQLIADLSEATEVANKATPKEKSKANAAVESIKGEISAAEQLIDNLSKELEALKA